MRAAAATALGKVGTAEEGRRSSRCWPTRIDDRAQPRAAGDRRAARPRGRAGPARDVRAEPPAGARHARARARCAASATRRRATSSASSCSRTTRSSGGSPSRASGASPTPSMLPAFKKDYQREKNGDVRLAYNFAIVLLGDRAFLDSLVLALGGSGSTAGHARDLRDGARAGDRPRPLPVPERPRRRGPRSGRATCSRSSATSNAVPEADAAPRRPQLEGGRPRQPRDREAAPDGARRRSAAVTRGARAIGRRRCCCSLGAGCGRDGASSRPARAPTRSPRRGRCVERAALRRRARARRRERRIPRRSTSRAGPGPARRESAPVPTPAPGSAAGARLAPQAGGGAGARGLRARHGGAPRPRWTRTSRSPSSWRRTRWRRVAAAPRPRPRRAGAADPTRSMPRAPQLRRRASRRTWPAPTAAEGLIRLRHARRAACRRRTAAFQELRAAAPRGPGAARPLRGLPGRPGRQPGGGARAVRPGAHLAARRHGHPPEDGGHPPGGGRGAPARAAVRRRPRRASRTRAASRSTRPPRRPRACASSRAASGTSAGRAAGRWSATRLASQLGLRPTPLSST